MSVLIQGMNMPKEVTLLAISPDGTVDIVSGQPDLSYITLSKKAVPVPDHGRLIDEKDIIPKSGYIIADGMACVPVKYIASAPTIIPADKDEQR